MNRVKPYLLLAAGLAPMAFCWMEFAHRIRLYHSYGCKPFLNHVADGYFGIMQTLAASALALFAIGLFMAVRQKNTPRVSLYSCAIVLAVGYLVALWYVHQSDVLVTYTEFVENLGP